MTRGEPDPYASAAGRLMWLRRRVVGNPPPVVNATADGIRQGEPRRLMSSSRGDPQPCAALCGAAEIRQSTAVAQTGEDAAARPGEAALPPADSLTRARAAARVPAARADAELAVE